MGCEGSVGVPAAPEIYDEVLSVVLSQQHSSQWRTSKTEIVGDDSSSSSDDRTLHLPAQCTRATLTSKSSNGHGREAKRK